jgi:hypothetical protein
VISSKRIPNTGSRFFPQSHRFLKQLQPFLRREKTSSFGNRIAPRQSRTSASWQHPRKRRSGPAHCCGWAATWHTPPGSRKALAAYDRLALLDGVAIGGAAGKPDRPLCAMRAFGQSQGSRAFHSEVQQFRNELGSGRWTLTAPIYWLYAGDVARWAGVQSTAKGEPDVLAEAAESRRIYERVRVKGVRALDIQPGGNKLAFFTPGTDTTEVWVMENFLTPVAQSDKLIAAFRPRIAPISQSTNVL